MFAGGSIIEYIIAAIITGTCSIIATVIGKEVEQLQEYRQEAIGFRQENERLKQAMLLKIGILERTRRFIFYCVQRRTSLQ